MPKRHSVSMYVIEKAPVWAVNFFQCSVTAHPPMGGGILGDLTMMRVLPGLWWQLAGPMLARAIVRPTICLIFVYTPARILKAGRAFDIS